MPVPSRALYLLTLVAPVALGDADYGEIQVLNDYQDREEKLGHVYLGPITSWTDSYFAGKQRWTTASGVNWVIEVAPQTQKQLDGGGGSISNNETNLIAQWAMRDKADPARGSLIVWYQFSSTWGNRTTSDFQDNLGILSPPNGGDTAPASSRNLTQHFAWEQQFFDNRVRVQFGKLTSRVLFNLNRYAVSDREDFFTPMLVNNPVASYTARIGLGLFGEYKRDGWYASAMIRDADADLSKKFIDFDSLDSGNWEYVAELALTPSDVVGLGRGVYRITYSHADSTEAAASGVPSTSSVSLSFDQDLGERVGAFFRFAKSADTFRAFDRRTAVGLQLKQPFGFANDRVGAGFWWARPTDPTLRSESGVDFFYKLQVARFAEISAGAQVIFDPAFRTDKNNVTIGQLRLRLVF